MYFNYLLEKIQNAPILTKPFSHVFIPDFFNQEDFLKIITSAEICVDSATSDEELFKLLENHGYEIITFPNCLEDKQSYIDWHKTKKPIPPEKTCMRTIKFQGMVLRLTNTNNTFLVEIGNFLISVEFQEVLSRKFNIYQTNVYFDSGIQKYLDGYEIAPHCDTIFKALTYMLNINPDHMSEQETYHTHYLTLKDSRKYVQTYWKGNPTQERTHVPWNWCDTNKTQALNNSLVIFSPSVDTFHAVQADYDHLKNQRTQIYGNFWYINKQVDHGPAWMDFDFKPSRPPSTIQRDNSYKRPMQAT